ncbi:MAG: hypothetical protein HC851_03535 [Acaryochloris sp. RU_4_1]|nr:hypothetical protein [Acaryochloris sp. RU_4_1]
MDTRLHTMRGGGSRGSKGGLTPRHQSASMVKPPLWGVGARWRVGQAPTEQIAQSASAW